MTKNKIVLVSDVRVGYSAPQIILFTRYLSQKYDAEGIIIEPDEIQKPKLDKMFPDLTIKSVSTSTSPYSTEGRKEYLQKATKIVEDIQPDIFVIWTTFCLPILFELKKRPKFVIYYYYETAMFYGDADIELNKKLGSLVDLIVFTEENRAARFGEVCGFQDIPFCMVYNCVKNSDNSIIPPEKRNGRIIYQGTIREDACIDYYLDYRMQSLPIDIYGNIDKSNKEWYQTQFDKLHEDVKYKGYVNSAKLEEQRKQYLYSVIIWKPIHENNLYACPNKFFESISSGVPPITAPHPQCKILTNRYDCGLVMNDWDFDSFYQKIKLGLEYYQTGEFERLVKNCMRAVKEELDWDIQIKKIKPYLKTI